MTSIPFVSAVGLYGIPMGWTEATMALAHEGSANQCKLHDLPAIAAEKDNNHSREPGLVIPQ